MLVSIHVSVGKFVKDSKPSSKSLIHHIQPQLAVIY